MAYPLYISAAGAQVQSTRLEVISNNLANVNTPGFKRDLAVFQARYAQATTDGASYPGDGSINNVGGGVMVESTKTDFSPAVYKQTGIETDLAVEGDAFFVVQHGDEQLLTRAGDFRFSPDGMLVTQEGDPVMSEASTPITIDPDLGPWEINGQGELRQASNVTPLALVRPQSLGDLAKAGQNNFRPLAPVSPLAPEQRHVLTRHLETSGVTPPLEMMGLIEASRAFEANVNMIRHQDQMLSALVNRVLKNS